MSDRGLRYHLLDRLSATNRHDEEVRLTGQLKKQGNYFIFLKHPNEDKRKVEGETGKQGFGSTSSLHSPLAPISLVSIAMCKHSSHVVLPFLLLQLTRARDRKHQ